MEPPARIPSSRASRRAIIRRFGRRPAGTRRSNRTRWCWGSCRPRFLRPCRDGRHPGRGSGGSGCTASPTGSPATTRTLGFFSFRYLPAPLDRPAGARSRHQMGDPPPGLLPDLGSRGGVVRLGIDLVVELIGQDGARRVLGDLLGLHHVVVGMIRRDRRRRDDDLRAVRLEQADLLLRHLVGHGEHAAVALERRRDGQAHAGIAAGSLDDGPAGAKLTPPLRRFDDGEADPVLHRAARIHILGLAVDRSADPAPSRARRMSGVQPTVSSTDSYGLRCWGWLMESGSWVGRGGRGTVPAE